MGDKCMAKCTCQLLLPVCRGTILLVHELLLRLVQVDSFGADDLSNLREMHLVWVQEVCQHDRVLRVQRKPASVVNVAASRRCSTTGGTCFNCFFNYTVVYLLDLFRSLFQYCTCCRYGFHLTRVNFLDIWTPMGVAFHASFPHPTCQGILKLIQVAMSPKRHQRLFRIVVKRFHVL